MNNRDPEGVMRRHGRAGALTLVLGLAAFSLNPATGVGRIANPSYAAAQQILVEPQRPGPILGSAHAHPRRQSPALRGGRRAAGVAATAPQAAGLRGGAGRDRLARPDRAGPVASPSAGRQPRRRALRGDTARCPEYLRRELPALFGRLQQLGFTEPQLREAAMAVLQEEEWGRAETEAPANQAPEPNRTEPPPAAAEPQVEPTPPAGNVP